MERSVDVYVHEEDMARMERSNSRSHFLCLVLLIVLLATNGAWLYYESQFTDVSTTYEAEQKIENGAGNAIITDGVHINGTDNAECESNN